MSGPSLFQWVGRGGMAIHFVSVEPAGRKRIRASATTKSRASSHKPKSSPVPCNVTERQRRFVAVESFERNHRNTAGYSLKGAPAGRAGLGSDHRSCFATDPGGSRSRRTRPILFLGLRRSQSKLLSGLDALIRVVLILFPLSVSPCLCG